MKKINTLFDLFEDSEKISRESLVKLVNKTFTPFELYEKDDRMIIDFILDMYNPDEIYDEDTLLEFASHKNCHCDGCSL